MPGGQAKWTVIIALGLVALACLALLALRQGPVLRAAPLERSAQLAVPVPVPVDDVAAHAAPPKPAAPPAPSAPAAPAAPANLPNLGPKPPPALLAAFERESPDATAPAAEAQLRAFYTAERDADTILRGVRCTRSVCKVELRWSPELNEPYNNALVQALETFSRDIDLRPDLSLGGPEMPLPMTLYIARPGHSVETLLAEQAALRP